MKKCSKCGAENKDDSSACFNCFAALDDAKSAGASSTPAEPRRVAQPQSAQPVDPADDESTGEPQPLGGEEEGPVSTVGQPLNAGAQGPSPYGPPRTPRLEGISREPVKKSGVGSAIAVLVVLIVLAAGAFAAWKYIILPRGPVMAVRTFINASSSNDMEAMKNSLSEGSQAMFQMAAAMGGAGRMNMMGGSGEKMEEGKQFTLKLGSMESKSAKVLLKPGPEAAGEFNSTSLPETFKDGLPIVVVKEDKGWKVDLMGTAAAMAGPMMQEMMKRGGGKMPGMGGMPGGPGMPPGR